ncbi:MAG: hypothetical protein ACOYJ1_14440 [Peptococcales bacterium]|jgi:hypothetical protein
MENGAIVMSNTDNEKLFCVKGIINGNGGRKITILEELCKCSGKANFAYMDSLNVVWAPKVLCEKREEYEISDLDENILMSGN